MQKPERGWKHFLFVTKDCLWKTPEDSPQETRSRLSLKSHRTVTQSYSLSRTRITEGRGIIWGQWEISTATVALGSSVPVLYSSLFCPQVSLLCVVSTVQRVVDIHVPLFHYSSSFLLFFHSKNNVCTVSFFKALLWAFIWPDLHHKWVDIIILIFDTTKLRQEIYLVTSQSW